MNTVEINPNVVLPRIRKMLGLVVFGLVISGLTAFPLETELAWLAGMVSEGESPITYWLLHAYEAIKTTNSTFPMLAYGTDWLAFAHLILGILFIGPMVDPVRNKWVILFGLMACAGIVPLALIAGSIREIPVFWQLIDISFGVLAAIPLGLALHNTIRLEKHQTQYAQIQNIEQ